VAEQAEGFPRLASHLVKVAHHGSVTGYTPNLYREHLGRPKKPLAVLTPFNRHRTPLPRRDGLEGILPWVSELFATNLAEALVASGLEDEVTLASLPGGGIPERWLRLLPDRPDLRAALNPVLRVVREPDGSATPGSDEPPGEVPPELLLEVEANPHLLALLHPRLRTRAGRAYGPPESACRISFYFNHRGQELREQRQVGPCAGVILSTPKPAE
jgi:hypothetical protein